MARNMDMLRELTESGRLAGSLSQGNGRYARTPDYTRPASRSSRPISDRGTTFHFAHKAMSKSNDMSDSNRTHTTSGAHQGYIERPGATEQIDEGIERDILSVKVARDENGETAKGFVYPERQVEPGRASFGTLGTTKAERKEFWNEIERTSGKRARVQTRIIAELPVEFSIVQRCRAARDFCLGFEERGLAYWATLHAPGKRNDDRNYHLHITYFDRPTGRDERGRWSHAVVEKRRKKSRHVVETMPYRSNKHPDTRARDWPKRLRRSYADTCNFHLATGEIAKRYDPRSYRESGIAKEPTEHLGTKLSALETMGLDTTGGQRNARREIRWKVAQSEKPWIDRIATLKSCEGFGQDTLSSRQDAMIETASAGITHARKSASFSIMSDMITVRSQSRSTFLEEEIARLEKADDMADLARRNAAVIALSAEREMLSLRAPQIEKTAKKCRESSSEEARKSALKLRQFDTQMKVFDPNSVFDEGREKFNDIDEFVTETDTTRDRPEPDFDASDLRNIEDLFGIDTRVSTPQSGEKDEAANDPGVDMPGSRAPGADPAGPAPFLRVEDVLSRISEDQGSAGTTDGADEAFFPGAWAVQPTTDNARLADLDRRLAEMNNAKLRSAAIASRDAADLSPGDRSREEFGRGWAVLRFEAERRGLDLDTGIHRPADGSDQERARLHTDQDPCPIRIVRKNIARQRVRT